MENQRYLFDSNVDRNVASAWLLQLYNDNEHCPRRFVNCNIFEIMQLHTHTARMNFTIHFKHRIQLLFYLSRRFSLRDHEIYEIYEIKMLWRTRKIYISLSFFLVISKEIVHSLHTLSRIDRFTSWWLMSVHAS